eukprot:GHVT01078380.1.p3 GENE.GHVT01078380.1~~GHVT01078380.1.p3  ORF type:complete len:175 (-),score=45.30 GHVT01078380.1:323-847(-)
MCMVPRRALDVMRCEEARILKGESSSSIMPISFCVLRKQKDFYQELYPPVKSLTPASKATEWVNGGNFEVERIAHTRAMALQPGAPPRAVSVVGKSALQNAPSVLARRVDVNDATIKELEESLDTAEARIKELERALAAATSAAPTPAADAAPNDKLEQAAATETEAKIGAAPA